MFSADRGSVPKHISKNPSAGGWVSAVHTILARVPTLPFKCQPYPQTWEVESYTNPQFRHANLSVLGVLPIKIVSCYVILGGGSVHVWVELTVTNAMASLSAVVAGNCSLVKYLLLLSRAVAADMAKLFAVRAQGDTTRNWLPSIGKTSHVFLGIGWPDVFLAGPRRATLEAIRNAEFPVQISLEVHIGQGCRHVRLLHSNEEKRYVFSSQKLFKINIRSFRKCFQICLDSSFGIAKVLVYDGSAETSQSFFGGYLGESTAINLSRNLTRRSVMACTIKDKLVCCI